MAGLMHTKILHLSLLRGYQLNLNYMLQKNSNVLKMKKVTVYN